MQNDYNYETAGFDAFLSKSIDNTPQVNLSTQGPTSTAIRYDDAQVSGFLGNTIQAGGVNISQQSISINNVSQLLIGKQTDGTIGMTVSKEGKDADINRPQDLIFNSNQDIFKVGITGTYTFPPRGGVPIQGDLPGPGIATVYMDQIPHGLGVTPIVECYIKMDNSDPGNVFHKDIFTPWNNAITSSGNLYPLNHSLVQPNTNNEILYILYAGADDTFLYVGEHILSNDPAIVWSTISQTFTYYAYSNSAAG